MEPAHKLSPPAGRPNNASEAFDFIIAAALKQNVSDIHLSLNQPTAQMPEPYLLRFRVFGKLQVVKSSYLTLHYKELVARLKVLSGMPTTEVGVPLDGQMTVTTPIGNVVLRISTIPNLATEEVVIRILRNNEKHLRTDQLQMTEEMKARLNRIIRQKSGLILLNGPAGSGKTTTIYSIINTIASPEKKILTAEDPVETRIPYVNHTQVSSRTNFASLSKAFMRQDADIIFIGEIRDEESASTALQLAQTGHLVLSTLHSRDSVGVISRLEALNVHPNNIATTLIGSLSQRLVPALCEKCKVPGEYDGETMKALNDILPMDETVKLYRPGPGCESCVAGYSGRIPFFELFIVDEELSDAINQRRSKTDLVNIARNKGMTTLAEEALFRVYSGFTDVDSVRNFITGPNYDLV